MEHINNYFSELMNIDLVLKLDEAKRIPFWDLSKYTQFSPGFRQHEQTLQKLANAALNEIILLNPNQIQRVKLRIDEIDKDYDKIVDRSLYSTRNHIDFDKMKRIAFDSYFETNYINESTYDDDWFSLVSQSITNMSPNFYFDFSECCHIKESSFFMLREKLKPYLVVNEKSSSNGTGFKSSLVPPQIESLFDQLKGKFISDNSDRESFIAIFKEENINHKIAWTKIASRNKQVSKTALFDLLELAGINRKTENFRQKINKIFTKTNGDPIQVTPSNLDNSKNFDKNPHSEYYGELIEIFNSLKK